MIIIAHRLSTVGRAEYIYLLENGMILEEGTIEQLQEREGSFHAFAAHQQ